MQQNIGHVSPEIFNAFPRKHGPDALTAYEVRAPFRPAVSSPRGREQTAHPPLLPLALSCFSPSLPVDLPQAIVTGFESVYSYRRATPEQAGAIDAVLAELDHPLLTPDFLSQPFAALTAGEQSLILLLRALVKRPPLLVLDEPFSGMDKLTVDKAQRFLDKLDSTQAVILITHFEEEVPRSVNRVLRLDEGAVVERI